LNVIVETIITQGIPLHKNKEILVDLFFFGGGGGQETEERKAIPERIRKTHF
jgi:hypothetical protein